MGVCISKNACKVPTIYFKTSNCGGNVLFVKKYSNQNNHITICYKIDLDWTFVEFSNFTKATDIVNYIRLSGYLQKQIEHYKSVTVGTNMVPNLKKTFQENNIDSLFEYITSLLEIMVQIHSIRT